VSKIMSNIAEAFVFTYLGLTFINSLKNKFSLTFVLCELVFVTCGRYCSIHGLSFIFTRIFKLENFKIKDSDKGIMSFAGSIRGAIAFGLAISIDTPNREILISGTLVLVFITTILFGAFMPYVFKYYKKDEMTHSHDPLLEKQLSFQFIQSNPNIGGPEEYIYFNTESLKKY
jgi:NhaP-type Na+/H+ or K+/H+ antiporter